MLRQLALLALLAALAELSALLGLHPHTPVDQMRERFPHLLQSETFFDSNHANLGHLEGSVPAWAERLNRSPIVGPAVRFSVRKIVQFASWWRVGSGGEQGENDVLSGVLGDGFGRVSVSLDELGRPTVTAESEADGYAAQGFLHARERLWQMEAARRFAQGRLSQVIGPKALVADRFSRIMGFSRAAERDAKFAAARQPEILKLLDAYADGVNAYVSHVGKSGGELPLEFALLNITWEPWTSLHTLQFSHLLGFMMTKGHDGEIVRAELHRVVGIARAHALDPVHVGDGLLREGILHAHHSAQPISREQRKALEEIWEDSRPLMEDWRKNFAPETDADLFTTAAAGLGGSNAWAISGKHTKSGKPIVASDPHLPLSQPSIWYQIRLMTEGADDAISGVSIPGAPGVMIGTTSHVAWFVSPPPLPPFRPFESSVVRWLALLPCF
jgi:penicillin G amidase